MQAFPQTLPLACSGMGLASETRFAVVSKMSEYYSGLDESRKKRYKQKLEAVGLTLEDDPYAPQKSGKVCE